MFSCLYTQLLQNCWGKVTDTTTSPLTNLIKTKDSSSTTSMIITEMFWSHVLLRITSGICSVCGPIIQILSEWTFEYYMPLTHGTFTLCRGMWECKLDLHAVVPYFCTIFQVYEVHRIRQSSAKNNLEYNNTNLILFWKIVSTPYH